MYSDVVIDDDRMCALPEEGNVLHELSNVLPDHNDSDDETTDHSTDDQEIFCSSGVPDLKDPSLNNTLNNTLLWPQIGYLTLAFPYLFPHGEADYSMPRMQKVPLSLYVQHIMQYKDESFAKDERFRYFIMNTQMRWNALNLGNLYVKKNEFFSKMTIVQLKEYLSTHKELVKQIMLLGKNVDDISISERAALISQNPLIADTYFYLRSKFFIDHCFKPHFGITDIWYRFEFQHRGSVRLHGLAWFENAPKLTKDM
ncbi:hypothetical protein FOCC_FOCC005586, partial [Frankliniella occidentalis]